MGVLVCGTASSWSIEGGANPYGEIPVRNAFGLKPPEPPKAPEPPKEETAPPNIFMTGVTSIGGKKLLYLKLVIPGEKEPKYLSLAENEREGAIEVVEIMSKTGRARIKNKGIPQIISFESNGAQAQVAAAPAVVPGRPGVPGMPAVPGVPGAPVSANNSVANKPITTSSTLQVSPNNTAINGGVVRPTGTSGAVNPQGTSNTPQSTPTRTIPSRPLRMSPTGGGASYTAPSNPEVPVAVQQASLLITDSSKMGPPAPK